MAYVSEAVDSVSEMKLAIVVFQVMNPVSECIWMNVSLTLCFSYMGKHNKYVLVTCDNQTYNYAATLSTLI